MTQQADEQEIQQQFAQLQAEMKRVMAEPAAPPPDAAHPAATAVDFQRIEQGLSELRRDADLLRARMVPAAGQPISADTLAALRAWTDEGADRLTRAVQQNREAIDDLAIRLDALSHRRPTRWVVPLAILLGALAIAAAVLLSVPGRIEQLVDLSSATVVPATPLAENVPPAPPAPAKAEIAAVTPPPPPAPPAASAPPVAEPPAPAPTPPIAETPATAAPAVTEPPAPATAPPATLAPQVAEAPASAAQPPIAHGRIVLRATGDTWVEVRNRQGGVLIARLLRDGDSWAVPDQAGLFLSTGNAGGLELLVDGTAAPSLGGVGGVRRDVPLDSDLVRAGRYTPDPTARPKPSAANR